MAVYDFPFGIQDVCDLEGIRLPNDGRANFTTVCPACGKRALTISKEKHNFHCFSCDEHGGVLQLYVLCENRADMTLSEARKEIMTRLFGHTSFDTEEKKKAYQKRLEEKRRKMKEDEIPQSQLRTEVELNDTNNELLNLLTLSDDHYKDLIRRGLDDNVIKARKYRSYPISGFQEIPLKLMEEGLYVDGIPGFFRNKNEKWELAQLKRGFMIPIINHHNLICGFQIRKDNSRLKEGEKKFTWLSSRGRKDGVGVPGSIHYACDFLFKDGKYIPKLSHDNGIVLTEGPLKADIFFSITKYPVIAVPGVSCQNQLEVELDFLKEIGVKTIYNAYDMDCLTNEKVFQALKSTYELIIKKGFTLKRIIWDEKDKGLDDHYVSVYKNVEEH